MLISYIINELEIDILKTIKGEIKIPITRQDPHFINAKMRIVR